MKFNEDSRVKIPSILHLTRLGYTYLSLKGLEWDASSNIVPSLFCQSVSAINPSATSSEIETALAHLDLVLDNEDLGKQFYEKITQTSGLKIIDFEDFDRNSFHVVTEFTCKKGDEEFRPDITLLINGLPLVFIEVKKPNNRDGILAERSRIITRFKNSKFKRFINLTQFMVFSNNMEYDNASSEPLEGAFYAAPAYGEPVFNYFREEEALDLDQLLQPENQQTEDFVLADNNLASIKHSPEFTTNKNPHSPTNRLSTSLLSRSRLAFMLRFGLAYVKTEKRLEKHVMRYPQIFATKAIESKINAGIRKGIIWHTQGSGKTALAFYSVHFLTDYFQKKGVIPKFYFIVDRIDLLDQACREFRSRGLHVHTITSREEFAEDIKSNLAVHNHSGLPEITVVNIHRFADAPDVVKNGDYALNLQRVYFLDEVHRSYNPQGSFLANLNQSDGNAIQIGLTGTPLLNGTLQGARSEDGSSTTRQTYNSKLIFGDYIHKYYYNRSIADGYTLRLLREEIETKYRLQLKEALIWGFPKKMAKPRLEVDADALVGTLDYGKIRVANGTIGYKYTPIDAEAEAAKMMETPNYLLKIIPNPDCTPGLCQLVRYHAQNVKIQQAWTGPAALQLFQHALAPVANLPVLEVVGAKHLVCESYTISPGEIVFDYLKE